MNRLRNLRLQARLIATSIFGTAILLGSVGQLRAQTATASQAAGTNSSAATTTTAAPSSEAAVNRAGRILFAAGSVFVEDQRGAASRIPLRSNDTVVRGQTVVTGKDGRVQLQLTDGSLFSLQPNTQFRIDEYVFSAREQRGFFSLLRGALRTSSGAIGKRNPEDYRLKTPSGTVGIRGTVYLAEETVCDPTCSPGLSAGLRVQVQEGRVLVSNNAGERLVNTGEGALVPSDRVAPQSLDAPIQWTTTQVSPSSNSVGGNASQTAGVSTGSTATSKGDINGSLPISSSSQESASLVVAAAAAPNQFKGVSDSATGSPNPTRENNKTVPTTPTAANTGSKREAPGVQNENLKNDSASDGSVGITATQIRNAQNRQKINSELNGTESPQNTTSSLFSLLNQLNAVSSTNSVTQTLPIGSITPTSGLSLNTVSSLSGTSNSLTNFALGTWGWVGNSTATGSPLVSNGVASTVLTTSGSTGSRNSILGSSLSSAITAVSTTLQPVLAFATSSGTSSTGSAASGASSLGSTSSIASSSGTSGTSTTSTETGSTGSGSSGSGASGTINSTSGNAGTGSSGSGSSGTGTSSTGSTGTSTSGTGSTGTGTSNNSGSGTTSTENGSTGTGSSGSSSSGTSTSTSGNSSTGSSGSGSTGTGTSGTGSAGSGSSSLGSQPPVIAPGLITSADGLHVELRNVPFLSAASLTTGITSVSLNANGHLQSVGLCPTIACLSVGTAEVREAGYDSYAAWGRWTNGQVRSTVIGMGLNSQIAANEGMHYLIGSPSLSMPTSGSATYSLQGATLATGEGTLLTFSGRAAVLFAPNLGTKVGLETTLSNSSGIQYQMMTLGGLTNVSQSELRMTSLNRFSGTIGVTSTNTNSECAGNSGCSARVDGSFYGNEQQRLGLSYQIRKPGNGRIDGVAVFKRD